MKNLHKKCYDGKPITLKPNKTIFMEAFKFGEKGKNGSYFILPSPRATNPIKDNLTQKDNISFQFFDGALLQLSVL